MEKFIELPDGVDFWTKSVHLFNDGIFKAKIINFCGEFTYELRFSDIEIDNKEIINTMHNGVSFKSLNEAICEAEKSLTLLHYALDESPQKLWVFKGVTLGFTELKDMIHLKEL